MNTPTDSRKDGGAAFPRAGQLGPDKAVDYPGMTLRDYFAAKAMQGICAALGAEAVRAWLVENADADGTSPKGRLATAAYEYADAMLAARSKP